MRHFMLIVLILAGFSLSAQINKISNRQFTTESVNFSFLQKNVDIDKGQIISNVVRIVSHSTDTLFYRINLNFPPDWKTLLDQKKINVLLPKDSVFVPVRLIPSGFMKGNTKYFINASIETEENQQLAADYFYASTKKVSKWEMNITPSNRIYFLNGQNKTSFDVNLFNSGNEVQDLMMTMIIPKSNLIITDTSGKALDDLKYDMTLKPREDTTFNFNIKYIEGERNFKNVDLENYNPSTLSEEKRYSIFLHSEEPRRYGDYGITRNTKLDLVKLPNSRKANPFGSDVLPLSAYLRVSNLLGDIVFSSLHLRGNKYLNNGGNLIYNASFYFSSQENFYKNGYAKNIPWYIGYFDDKKNVQIGYVNGGAIGIQSSGKGIKGEITVAPYNRVGGFYIRSPYLFSEARIESFGLHHKLNLKNFSNTTHFAHSKNNFANVVTNVLSVNPKIRVAKSHNVNFILALSNRDYLNDPLNQFSRQGYLFGAGYTGILFKNVWKLNLRGTYTSKGFGANGFERFFLNHQSRIKVAKDFELSVVNNYNHYKYDESHYNYIPGLNENYYFFNSVNLYSARYFPNIKPGFFYDVRYHLGYDFHIRGLNFSYNSYNMTKNLQVAFITSLGYSRIMNQPGSKNHFVMRFNTMIRYHNLSFTGYYLYGPYTTNLVVVKEKTKVMPQNLRASIMHQYMFKNRHLILQTSLSYSFMNYYNHHSFTLNPELYYFTNSGWRFSINPSYALYSSKITFNEVDVPGYIDESGFEERRYYHDNFMVNLGVKKDFGIPIPTTFSDFSDVNFTAFYDVNGNKQKDPNEPGIENIVIKVGEWSVITSGEGNSWLKNVDPGVYDFQVMSLSDLKGWFPLIQDSLRIFNDENVYIPFVKGIKISGAVFIDRENFDPNDTKKLDISGIKISAVDGYTFSTLTGSDGTFELYLPFGEYTLSLDETILNGRYYITKNNYKLDLTSDIDNMYITFHIVEKRRKIRIKKFDSNGN